MQPQHQYEEIERALTAFVEPGSTFELRLLHHNKRRVDAGYFASPAEAASAVAALREEYAGIYFTPNPVDPILLARAANRIEAWAEYTTMDVDVVKRRWLLVDIDPKRPSGISSTQAELENAFKVGRTIANMLEFEGWPRPFINASGNGCHLLYPLDADNTDEAREAVKLFLQILNQRFAAEGCTVDTTTFNAARIFRLPGTWARKGDNIPDRPHRKAYQVDTPASPAAVTLLQVAKFNRAHGKFAPVAAVKARSGASEYPDDEKLYRNVNRFALENPHAWVPAYFDSAREYKKGFRIKAEDLGHDFEEDLTIHPPPLGIKYFGVADMGDATEGRRTPISLLAQVIFGGDKKKAATALADTLKMPLSEFEIIPFDTPGVGVKLPGADTPPGLFDFTKVPNMQQLQLKALKPITWLVPRYLPTGNILMSARPKMGKTWLSLQLAMAVSTGDTFLGEQCQQAEVLYLALEDNERRMQQRIKLLMSKYGLLPPDLSGFRYWCGGVDISPTTGRLVVTDPHDAARTAAAWPQGDAGIDALKRYLDTFPKTKLVVVDTLELFRGHSTERDIYKRDYAQLLPLTRLAAERDITIVPVHHNKKGASDRESVDFMEHASGSAGVTGGSDGMITIEGKRGPKERDGSSVFKIMMSGRDYEDTLVIPAKLMPSLGGWTKEDPKTLDVASQVMYLLTRRPGLKLKEILAHMETSDVTGAALSRLLIRLVSDRILEKRNEAYFIFNDFDQKELLG